MAGKVITADAMSMQKDIIDKIRKNGGDFLIELKANQRSLRYEIEDRIKTRKSLHSPAGPDQVPLKQSSSKSRHDPENSPLNVLHLEKTTQEED